MASDAARAWSRSQDRMVPRAYGGARSKLSAAQRGEIKQQLADGAAAQALAIEYGVTASLIRRLR